MKLPVKQNALLFIDWVGIVAPEIDVAMHRYGEIRRASTWDWERMVPDEHAASSNILDSTVQTAVLLRIVLLMLSSPTPTRLADGLGLKSCPTLARYAPVLLVPPFSIRKFGDLVVYRLLINI